MTASNNTPVYKTINDIFNKSTLGTLFNKPWNESIRDRIAWVGNQFPFAIQAFDVEACKNPWQQGGQYLAFVSTLEQIYDLVNPNDQDPSRVVNRNPTGIFLNPNELRSGVETRKKFGVFHLIKEGQGVGDSDFTGRRAFFFDFDPKRPSGISSTNDELLLAVHRTKEAWGTLQGVLEGILPEGTDPNAPLGLAMSGNGMHIHVRVDIPDTGKKSPLENLIDRALKAGQKVWGDAKVDVDQKVGNIARWAPLFGTWKKKGAHIETKGGRQHRRSAWASYSESVYALNLDELTKFVEELEALGEEPDFDNGDVSMDDPLPHEPQKFKGGSSSSSSGGFAPARELLVMEVAEWLGIVEGGKIRCPGCNNTAGVAPVPAKPTRLKCQHNTCNGKGNKGSRSALDLVMEVNHLTGKDGLKEAYKLLAERFSLPPLRGKGRPKTAASTPPPGVKNEDWEEKLRRTTRGAIYSDESNAQLILHNVWKNKFRWNEWTRCVELDGDPLWDEAEAPSKPQKAGDEWRCDDDDPRMMRWLQRNWGVGICQKSVYQTVCIEAKKKIVNPLRDKLLRPVWDGVSRLERAFHTYYGAPDGAYERLVARCFFVGAVARALLDESKNDCVLIIEGAQGIKKSQSIEAMAYEKFYSGTKLDIGNKDALVAVTGAVWIIELKELQGFNKGEWNTIKGFVDQKKDKFRPPYGAAEIEVYRHCVFVGTTNDSDYLRDFTGNRRFLPIRATKVELETLKEDMDQIWAEAIVMLKAGVRWWPETPEEKALCGEEQDERQQQHLWTESVATYISSKNEVTGTEILEIGLQIKPQDFRQEHRTIIGGIMASFGWVSSRKVVGGAKITVYKRKDPLPPISGVQAKSQESEETDYNKLLEEV